MITVAFDALAKAEIDALVANKTPELRALEYKEALPGNTDAAKKEFLADVSSFANAAGGHILYGVVAERDSSNNTTGAPESTPGLAINCDTERLRLESIIRNGIAPRIPGVEIRCIDGFAVGPVIAVHIPRSFAAPHMVTLHGTSRFYSRTSAGKQLLDVGEIRGAFAASEAIPQTIRRFREERLGRILSGDTPVPMEEGAAKLVVHLYPLSATRPGAAVNLTKTPELEGVLWPPNRPGYNVRYNLDGLLSFGANPPCRGYVQVFRNGSIEAVSSRTAYPATTEGGQGQIPSPAFESTLADMLTLYRRAFSLLGVEPPVSLMVSLLGVKGFRIMTTDGWGFPVDTYPIERDVLALPDILLEELDSDPQTVLRPIYDMAWQASGLSGCPHYDVDGNWINRR